MLTKDWNKYVSHAEEIARTPGFRVICDDILESAAVRPDETVVDIGAGTGLLTLPVARAARKVWAVDISSQMCEYLRAKAVSAGADNIDFAVASAVSLPLVDRYADVVISNYCFHHLRDDDKRRALSEVFRVLKPGGRFVFGDMMFEIGLVDARDRAVISLKVGSMVRKGLPGILRLASNGARLIGGRWERPCGANWWRSALVGAGFDAVDVTVLEHEGGIGAGVRPFRSGAELPLANSARRARVV